MPKIKQPLKLEALALKSSVKWLTDTGRKLMKIIETLTKREVGGSSEFLKSQVQLLYNIFEYNIPCYLFDRFCEEVFIAIPLLIESITKGVGNHSSSMGKYLTKVNVAVSLAEVVASPFLRILNFDDMPKMMRHLLYSKLKQMKGLAYLNLSSLSGGWKTCEMEPVVLNSVIYLHNLQVLILNYDCTDNILRALNTACPRLRTLDIASSKSISNNSIKYLVEFPCLRSLQLHRTSVSIEGYVQLLLKLPLLEDIGRFDEIGRCLEYIDMTYENFPDYPTLNLKIFSTRFVVTKHLQILAKMCPEIKHVSIFHNPLSNDLMALVPINKLAELRLLSCDFFGDQIRDVLQVKGCNITYLHFEHVDQIDMNALMYISQFCPDLKHFTIYNCELMESTSLYTRRLDIPPFINLERLTIAAQCKHQHLEFILSNCFKIKYIHIGTMVPTDDALFDRLLLKNPMQDLEELRIIFSNDLTIATAYKLVNVCPNLMILNELESWTRINKLELECFKIFIETRNFDLNIKPLRRCKTEEDDDNI